MKPSLAACTGLALALLAAVPARSEQLTVEREDSHERCYQWAAESKVEYRFEASGRLNFNIHYHDAGKTRYSVLERDIERLEGTLATPIEARYCVMWRNTSYQNLSVDYTLVVNGAEQ